MIPGLPIEYANIVLSTLMNTTLPGGRIVIDRAGFDPVESSHLSFSNAAELLIVCFTAQTSGDSVPFAIKRAMQCWA